MFVRIIRIIITTNARRLANILPTGTGWRGLMIRRRDPDAFNHDVGK
jgi:hypothetical protein